MTAYAEDLNYWKTSQTTPDTWLQKAMDEITATGGQILGHAFGSDLSSNREAYMISFQMDGHRFKEIEPVVPTRSGDEQTAARRQAATTLYHRIKAACVDAKRRGPRIAFFSALVLPDGRTTTQASVDELMDSVPEVLLGRSLPAPKGDS